MSGLRKVGKRGAAVEDGPPLDAPFKKPPPKLLRSGTSGREYLLQSKLGEGTYGMVYKARLGLSGALAAAKRMRLSEDEGVPSTAIRELNILHRTAHPHLIGLLDTFFANGSLWIILELMETDLGEFLHKRGRRPLLFHQIRSLLFQLCSGIQYLHSLQILHRDLKPQNILLTPGTGALKVGDFGLGCKMELVEKAMTPEVVTLWYRCPELILGDTHYSTALDMWSVGCVLGELGQNGQPIFNGECEIAQLFKIFQVLGTPGEATWPGISRLPHYNILWPNFPPKSLRSLCPVLRRDGNDLLAALLNFDKDQRFSAPQSLSHPFFTREPWSGRVPLVSLPQPQLTTSSVHPPLPHHDANLSPFDFSNLF